MAVLSKSRSCKSRRLRAPRNHRQLTPRGGRFGEFLFAARIGAKGQDPSQIGMERGSDPLTLAPWTQLNAVDQGAEHVGRLGPDVGVV